MLIIKFSALAIRLAKRWPGMHMALNHSQQPKVDLDRAKLLFTKTLIPLP